MIAANTCALRTTSDIGAGWRSPSSFGGDGPAPITLHVRDLEASRRFYSELLGFVPSPDAGYSDAEAVLVSPLLARGFRSIILSRSPKAHAVTGLLLELETTAEL